MTGSIIALRATGNADFGYFGGGETPDHSSTVDRIDYSNDTATASPKGSLTSIRADHAAASARAHGFVPIGPSVVSNAAAIAGSFNPTTVGFFAGGYNSSGELSIVDRIDYSNDTATALSLANLSFSAWSVSGTGNSFFGYFIGGETFPSPINSTINRVDYSNDTLSSSVSPLPIARSSVGAVSYTHLTLPTKA